MIVTTPVDNETYIIKFFKRDAYYASFIEHLNTNNYIYKIYETGLTGFKEYKILVMNVDDKLKEFIKYVETYN